MKIVLLFVLLCLPIVVSAQRKKADPNNPYKKSEMYKASKKLSAGGGLVAFGGGLIAGSVIMAVSIKANNEKTTTQIMAGAGGAMIMIGGVLIGNSAQGFWRVRNETARIKFTGNSLTYNF